MLKADKVLIFVLGATNSGKTSFLNQVKSEYPEKVYLIQVGKLLRAKYPPEYFEGESAPIKTQKEALEILFSEYSKATNYDYVFIDGQPRDLGQAKELSHHYTFSDRDCHVFHLMAPRHVRLSRALARDSGPTLDLSLSRLDKDVLHLHEVMMEFTCFPVTQINTDKESPLDVFNQKFGNH